MNLLISLRRVSRITPGTARKYSPSSLDLDMKKTDTRLWSYGVALAH